MQRSEKHEFLNKVIEDVKEIPVNEVISTAVELYPKGKYYLGLCPFHPDNHLGSFVVTPGMQLWKCFACGEAGNGISFIMKYYDLDFKKAVFKLALDFDIISMSEYEHYMRQKYDGEILKRAEREALAEKKVEKEPLPPVEELDMVYTAMAEICSLSEEHKTHLLEERHLSEKELKDYFTFPTRNLALARRIQDKIKAKTGEYYWNLDKIPGFYYDEDKEKVDFMSAKGIGILVRDANGYARGIQIRKDKLTKKDEPRYIWFTSNWAADHENYKGGNSPGSPGGVVYGPKKGQLCLTEGRFKAEAIAKTGNTAVYTCGVNNWKNMIPDIEKTADGRKKAYLMFDSDLLGNVAVHKHMKHLAEWLEQKNIKPVICLWSKGKGKGIDDIINNVGAENISKHCKYFDFHEFESEYKKELANVLKVYKVDDPKNLKTNKEKKSFADTLQKSEECRLCLQ